MTDKVADLIAGTAAFQTAVSAANAAAAKPRAYQYPTAHSAITRFCAFVWPPSQQTVGMGGYTNGELEIHFESTLTADGNSAEHEAFRALCLLITQQMMRLSVGGGYLMVRSIVQSEPMMRARQDEEKFFMLAYRVRFGPDRVP